MNNLYVIAYYINGMNAVCLTHLPAPIGMLAVQLLIDVNKFPLRDIEMVGIKKVKFN